MRPFLLVALGFALAIGVYFGLRAYQMFAYPPGSITNRGFSLVRVNAHNGRFIGDIRKGEAQRLPYGEYTLTIPELGESFVLFKNDRGKAILHCSDGLLIVETDANSTVMSADE